MDTNQQIIKLFEVKINDLFLNVKQLLLNPTSYQQEQNKAIKANNMGLYFDFIESAIQRPYNRLSAVFVFITDEEGKLCTSKMRPLSYLKSETKEEIEKLYAQAQKIVTGLEISGVDNGIVLLQSE